MEELQHVFGPLVKDQLDLMEWAPTMKRELAQRWGQGTRSRRPQPDLLDQSTGQTGAATGDSAKDPTPGLQLGALHSAGQSGATSPPVCGSTKMEEVSGRGSYDQCPTHHPIRVSDHDAACGPEGHRRGNADTLPDQSGGKQVATGWPLVLSEVVTSAGEPSGR